MVKNIIIPTYLQDTGIAPKFHVSVPVIIIIHPNEKNQRSACLDTMGMLNYSTK
jgi:hypothetical protein